MSQSLARLWTHLIFSTKNRFPFLTDKKLRTDMHAYLAKMLREQDCETLIVNGVEDHVHALFALSRTHSIASVVKEIKRTSSGFGKELSATLAEFRWQGGYGAFSVSQIQFGGSCWIYRKPGRASQASDFSGRIPRFLEGVWH